MLQSYNKNTHGLRLAILSIVTFLVVGCAATVPETARVRDVDLPNYKVGSHRVEEAIDLHIEPRIQNLHLNVTPRSENKVYNPIPVVVGPALEKALLAMTRQHFSKITTIPEPEGRPTLSYK